jgi:hypothetical protein
MTYCARILIREHRYNPSSNNNASDYGNSNCKSGANTSANDPVVRGRVESDASGTKFQAKGLSGGCFKNFNSATLTWEMC